jgi:hypothetical protein
MQGHFDVLFALSCMPHKSKSLRLIALGLRQAGERCLAGLKQKSPTSPSDLKRRANPMVARDKPSGIEPTVGLAVIRQPVDVPMADEGRIGGIKQSANPASPGNCSPL